MVWSRALFARQTNGGSVCPLCALVYAVRREASIKRSRSTTSFRANISSLDDALTIASAEGLNRQLCAPNSPFIEALDSCSACIKAQGSDPNGGATSLSPLIPFLEYCNLLSYSTLTYTSTDGQVTTIVYLLPTNNAATTTTSSSRTSTTSKKTSGATTPSRTSTLATQTSLAPQNAASSPSVAATPPSHAWIAGPIVGSIVGLAIVLGVSFYLWRRHRLSRPNTLDPMCDKAQLHSDCIPKPELDAQTNTIHEIDTQPAPPRAEIPVNEANTAELQTRDETESVAADASRHQASVLTGSAVSETSSRSNAKAITRKPIQT